MKNILIMLITSALFFPIFGKTKPQPDLNRISLPLIEIQGQFQNGIQYSKVEVDINRELIINPLLTSSFIGSNSFDDDYGPSMELDNEGNVYICGFTASGSFPYMGGYDSTYNGGKDIFIAKFSPDLSTLLVSTFIGGIGDEYKATMAFDPQKENLYLAGYTNSSDFPVTAGAYDTTINGGRDVYILKIDKELTTLQAASYFGGSASEGQQWPKLDIAVSLRGNVYITGLTCSEDLPIISGLSVDSTYAGGSIGGDAFIAKFDASLSYLLGSTYIGGSANEWRMSIALDQSENVFVSGETESSDFTLTPNAYDSSFNGYSDIFICKYNSALSVLETATCFGRTNSEEPLDLCISPDSSIYITGYTKSTNFPTTLGAFDNSYSGGERDAYIAKFNNCLSSLEASTFFGGNNRDDLTSILVNQEGKVFVSGNTRSTNYPHSTNAYTTNFQGGQEYGDACISVLNGDLTQMLASSYIGGQLDDRALDIHIDSTGNVLIAGYSKFANFPTTNGAYDTLNPGGLGDCFISKFTPDLSWENVGIIPEDNIPFNNFKLNSYPNPFNPNTNIEFNLDKKSKVQIEIFNTIGQKIITLTDRFFEQGSHKLYWNGKNQNGQTMGTGVYFCKMTINHKNHINHKMVLIK